MTWNKTRYQSDVAAFTSWLAMARNDYGPIDLHASIQYTGDILLHGIVVPESARNEGRGTRALLALCEYADAQNRRIRLTADSRLGTPLHMLIRWYKRLGFLPVYDDDTVFEMGELQRLPRQH